MSGPVTVALRRIEDLFADERCWRKHAYGTQGRPHCLVGATFDHAIVPPSRQAEVEDLLRETSAGLYEIGVLTLVNDGSDFGLPAVRLVVATALDVAEAEGL